MYMCARAGRPLPCKRLAVVLGATALTADSINLWQRLKWA